MRPIAIVVLLTGFATISATAAPICPATVVSQQNGVSPGPEWSVTYSTLPGELEMITFYSGPPNDDASLIYDDIVNGKETTVATWKFPREPRGYWVKCSYRGTTMELSRQLPATVTACRVTYERQEKTVAGLALIKRSDCQ